MARCSGTLGRRRQAPPRPGTTATWRAFVMARCSGTLGKTLVANAAAARHDCCSAHGVWGTPRRHEAFLGHDVFSWCHACHGWGETVHGLWRSCAWLARAPSPRGPRTGRSRRTPRGRPWPAPRHAAARPPPRRAPAASRPPRGRRQGPGRSTRARRWPARRGAPLRGLERLTRRTAERAEANRCEQRPAEANRGEQGHSTRARRRPARRGAPLRGLERLTRRAAERAEANRCEERRREAKRGEETRHGGYEQGQQAWLTNKGSKRGEEKRKRRGTAAHRRGFRSRGFDSMKESAWGGRKAAAVMWMTDRAAAVMWMPDRAAAVMWMPRAPGTEGRAVGASRRTRRKSQPGFPYQKQDGAHHRPQLSAQRGTCTRPFILRELGG